MNSLYFPSQGVPSLQLIPLPFIPKRHDLPQYATMERAVTPLRKACMSKQGLRNKDKPASNYQQTGIL